VREIYVKIAKATTKLVLIGMSQPTPLLLLLSFSPIVGILLTCHHSGDTSLWEESEQFTLLIDSIYSGLMRDFIAWDLEREHGDLGFGTLANPLEPPLSSFGIAFRKSKPNTVGQDWIQEVVDYVDGSVVQAKLALDRIHSSASPNLVDLHPIRIPANVQATFNVAINNIEKRSSTQRELALKSIAIVGKSGDVINGIPLSRLANLLKERPHQTTSTHSSPRSAEDILDAANGYLRLMPRDSPDEEYTIAAFHPLFYIFAKDEYNEELMMAYSQLRTSRIPRSYTHKLPSNRPEEPIEASWTDIIGDLKRFQSPDLSSMSAHKSPPPIRRESSSLMRSRTFFSSATPMASPPAGLGLEFIGQQVD
jgi:hypothetical protein